MNANGQGQPVEPEGHGEHMIDTYIGGIRSECKVPDLHREPDVCKQFVIAASA